MQGLCQKMELLSNQQDRSKVMFDQSQIFGILCHIMTKIVTILPLLVSVLLSMTSVIAEMIFTIFTRKAQSICIVFLVANIWECPDPKLV